MELDREKDTNLKRAGSKEKLNSFITLPGLSLGQTASWTTLSRIRQEAMTPDPCK